MASVLQSQFFPQIAGVNVKAEVRLGTDARPPPKADCGVPLKAQLPHSRLAAHPESSKLTKDTTNRVTATDKTATADNRIFRSLALGRQANNAILQLQEVM
jgi:hypothetical protein